MKPESIRTIAGKVPTTSEELTCLGVLGENIIKEYGEHNFVNVSSCSSSFNCADKLWCRRSAA